MGFWYWFRVGMMALSLASVMYVMHWLNRTPRAPDRTAAIVTQVNLCPTRITRVETGQVTLFEEKMQWYRQEVANSAAPERLDPVAVEKWFSRHCTLTGKRVSASANVATAATVSFVSGEPLKLLRSLSQLGEYEWQGLSFQSAQLTDALHELNELPKAKEPTK